MKLFVYVSCRAVDSMRSFYSGALGLAEVYFSVDEGALAYDCGGVQLAFFADPKAVSAPEGWATQPGWVGGTAPITSWSIQMTEGAFRSAVDRLVTSNVDRVHRVPDWVGYWSFPVKDPMGNTVEISWAPAEAPSPPTWAAAVGSGDN